MALRDRIAYLRKEHRVLLRLADKIEGAVSVSSKADFLQHQRCISELRALEHGLHGIEEHCRAEDRAVESTYHHYANRAELQHLDAEHTEIVRTLTDFRDELRFATADRTESLRAPGMALVTRLRSHIDREERVLREIEKSEARRRRVRKSKRLDIAAVRPRRATKQRGRVCKETRYLSYTMEPHPEL
jgi:hemerythrin-like domain-containing protein